MKAQTTAIVTIIAVLGLVLASTSAITYSWWSDSEETEITITSGSLDVSTDKFDVKHNGSSLGTGLGSIPGLISVQYDDGRLATTKWWSESDSLTIAGNPGDVNVEILYEVTFSGNIDYKYIIDVVCPEGIDATVSVKDEGGNAVTYGSWKAPASEPTGPFEMKFYVSSLIKSIDADVYGEKLKIVNMITQYNNPIDIWDGSTPASLPDTLEVDVTDKVISINDAKALAYLSTLNNNWDSSAYGSKWKYSIELNTNIDLNGLDWTPINLSNFVAFDGNGHTIYNLNVSTGDNAGLFASITCNDIGVTYVKDLNIVNAVVEGKECVGALVGAGTQAVVSGVVVDNAVVTGTKYVGGIFGHGNGSVNDCVVKNSNISVKYDGKKEAGGLIGYLSNDGLASTVDKVISGNFVENVTVFAPTVASGLVSQPNSSNIGGAIIVIKDNTMIDVVVSTNDASASLYVSNNVSNKSSVVDNSAIGCQINHGFFVMEYSTNITVPKSDDSTDVDGANITMPDFGEMVTISAQIVDDAPADFKAK
ncbi:MAG: hypothetical protein J6R75_00525, partial [Candidatus Methanomethylophilaceae archaeon]|nr:hypothetical protein [Candidatus Methanomethylophilaceae archaeon]